jgi:hypothetical protein
VESGEDGGFHGGSCRSCLQWIRTEKGSKQYNITVADIPTVLYTAAAELKRIGKVENACLGSLD